MNNRRTISGPVHKRGTKFTPGMVIGALVWVFLFHLHVSLMIIVCMVLLSLVIDALLGLRPARAISYPTEKRYYKNDE